MIKTIRLALNKFSPIPKTLRDPGHQNVALKSIDVDLASLYLHYYWDSWGIAPPDPNPVNFEHIQFLSTGADFKFRKGGRGAASTFRGNKSNELGQAFCRWFLEKHVDITHFAHLEDVRDHGALAEFKDASVETNHATSGDAPDYFCADSSGKVFLAEAKGTNVGVGFGSKTFANWRQQFKRVTVRDASGKAVKVKGFIVATRWASEGDGPRVFTKISAEDPETEGVGPLSGENRSLLAAVKSAHYGSTLRKLGQPLLSAAMQRGFRVAPETRFPAFLWRSVVPELSGMKFVGGYFPDGWGRYDDFSYPSRRLALRLDEGRGTFFGLEATVFRTIAEAARTGSEAILGLRPLEQVPVRTEGVAFLRDGMVLGPVELFEAIESQDF